MTARVTSWAVPAVGFAIGIAIAAALLGRDASPAEAASAFLIVAGYAIALKLLQTRSDVAGLLSGMPRDERWAAINLRALSLSAQVLAVVLVVAFLATEFGGGDAVTFAWLGGAFGATYLGGIVWYRSRS